VSAHCRRPGGTHRARHSGAVRVAMITPVAALAVASGVTVRVEARREALPPDGPQVVAQAALLAPVRVSRAMAARAGGGSVAPAVLRSRNGAPDYSAIPGVALAAYQRAELIMRSADKSCRLDWSLLAAIGYVESDHGRDGGSRLDAAGVARPGIQGDRRDGTRGAVAIRDTDSGLFDHDRRFDRAVGPMHFVPSTWLVVGVDADGDSKRDPQDIDDAALAAAVLLCSASDDLSRAPGTAAGGLPLLAPEELRGSGARSGQELCAVIGCRPVVRHSHRRPRHGTCTDVAAPTRRTARVGSPGCAGRRRRETDQAAGQHGYQPDGLVANGQPHVLVANQ